MKHFFALLLFLFPVLLTAQDFEVPENIVCKTEADFIRYEPQIIEAVEWLEKTPLKNEQVKRVQVQSFVVKWITETPTFSVVIQSYVSKITDDNPAYLALFLGGWAKYKIQHKEETSLVKLGTAGVQSILKNYALEGATKAKLLSKLQKDTSFEALEKWVGNQQ